MCRFVVSGITMYPYQWRGKNLLACGICLEDAKPGSHAYEVAKHYGFDPQPNEANDEESIDVALAGA
jgi:hypothetical protein